LLRIPLAFFSHPRYASLAATRAPFLPFLQLQLVAKHAPPVRRYARRGRL
jgi:hypothetical protein